MSALLDIDLGSISYVCQHMRDSDAREIYGLRPHNSSLVLAYEIHTAICNQGRGKVAWHDGKPAAVIGFAEYWPGVWQVILVGTDAFRDVSVDCLRWIRREAADIMRHHGGRRLQCDSRAGNLESQSFLFALGAKREAIMRNYGRDGAVYERYVWLAGENDQFLGVNVRRLHADAEATIGAT